MNAHYVYRCFDRTGRLIYIGCTINLGARLDYHLQGSWWALDVAKVKAVVCPSRATGRAMELRSIRAEKPRWNLIGRGPSRLWATEEEYLDYHGALSRCLPSRAAQGHMARTEIQFRERFGRDLLSTDAVKTSEPAA